MNETTLDVNGASLQKEGTSLDPETQKRAKIYARLSRRLMVVDLGLGGMYVLAWLFFGWSAGLKSVLLNLTANEWLLVIAYAAVFGAIYYLITLPLSFYEGQGYKRPPVVFDQNWRY